MSVDNLETFVNEGKITGDFGLYAGLIGKNRLGSFRQVLGQRFNVNPDLVALAVKMPIVDPLFRQIGQVLQVDSKTNGSEALRLAIITAAADPEGFTLLNVIRKFPAETIRVNYRLFLGIEKLQLKRLFNKQKLKPRLNPKLIFLN
jgi:hypothetical protein